MADHRSNVYWDEEIDRYVYRASALGNCETNLLRSRAGQPEAPTPEFLTKAYGAGVRAEDAIIRRFCQENAWKMVDGVNLEQYGKITDNGQVEVEINVGLKAVVRCHPDGIIECFGSGGPYPEFNQVGKRAVLEVKLLGPDMAKKLEKGMEGIPFYDWQAAVEANATGLPLVYVVAFKGDDGEYDETKPLSVKYWGRKEYPKTKVDIIRRVMKLEGMAEDIENGEMGYPECDWQQYPCPFYQLHTWGKKETPVELEDGEKQGKLEKLRDRFVVAKDQKKKWEDEYKEASAELLVGMSDLTSSGKWDNVTVVRQKRKGGLEEAKMKEDGIDVEKYRRPDYEIIFPKVKEEKE